MHPTLARIARGILPLLMLGLAIMVAPQAFAQTDDEIFDTVRTAFMAAESGEARLAVVDDFLAKHPNHPRAIDVIEAGTDVLAQEMDDRQGAIKLAKSQIAGADDEKTGQLQNILMDLYSAPGFKSQLADLVAEKFDADAMSFVDHLNVIKAASAAEAWTMVSDHCIAAKPLATPEAFRAAYPDDNFTDEYIEGAGKNRQGLLQTFAGWSAANLGDFDAAMKAFITAEDMVRPSFFNLPDNELYNFWGQALVMKGKTARGLEKLALAGLYGGDEEAATAARKAYDSLGKKADEYDDFLWELRLKHAPFVGDFKATDYEGTTHTFASLRGKKATLLAFWSPT